MFTDPALLVARLVFVGLAVEAVEVIVGRRAFADGALFGRSTTRLLTAGAPWPESALGGVGGSTAVGVFMAAQLAAATTVVAVGLSQPLGVGAALVCLATTTYLRARRPIGGSGADQLGLIVLVVVGLVWAAGWTPAARYLGDAFLAAQVALAYLTAGLAKAVSATWRSGRAMTAILSTEGYGTRAMGDFLSRHPGLDRTTCGAVITWEVTFPVIFVLPTPGVVAYLAVGVAFHVGCAVVMGLNRFVWSFCGCYPAVWAIGPGLAFLARGGLIPAAGAIVGGRGVRQGVAAYPLSAATRLSRLRRYASDLLTYQGQETAREPRPLHSTVWCAGHIKPGRSRAPSKIGHYRRRLKQPRPLSREGRARFRGSAQFPQERVALLSAVGVLFHDVFEKRRDVIATGVLGVSDVLPIIMSSF